MLSISSQSTACGIRTSCRIVCTDVNTVSTEHIALICKKAHAWLKFPVAPSIKSHSISCSASMSHDMHSTPIPVTSFSQFSETPSLSDSDSKSIQSRTHYADPHGLGGDGVPKSELRTVDTLPLVESLSLCKKVLLMLFATRS